MQEDQVLEALNAHWHASAIGDADAEHDIYTDDAVCEYPQSGERIIGRANLQALRSHHPGKPSGFNVRRIVGKGDLWITEYMITYRGRPTYTVSISSSTAVRSRTRPSISRTLSRRRTGGANGFSRLRDESPSSVRSEPSLPDDGGIGSGAGWAPSPRPCPHRHRRDEYQLLLGRPTRGLDGQPIQDSRDEPCERGAIRILWQVAVPDGLLEPSRNAATAPLRSRTNSCRTGSASSPHATHPTRSCSRVPRPLHADEAREDRLDHLTAVGFSMASARKP